ncbi:class I SAM-dependent methyltransferase [Ovoidimarina sediminis]|uniref:class I SAM-dependent methyltransferase n=1 Tax=Ovoidimarina sediminis TaxID=3079856 RepID=UPI002908D0CE|nr:class I SAM-dependent methyltransferase [Rhodophyticola sp. MJ-SS7]MDU8944742.1 class I SAM-dependent methyltransferase [Rhodophyticola sp. MJ-SS7]
MSIFGFLLPEVTHSVRSEIRLKRRYDQAAGGWHKGLVRLGYPAAYRRLVSAAPPASDALVVDIGTGSGLLAETWVDVSGPPQRLLLVDRSQEMLRRASMRFAARGIEADVVEGAIGSNALEECSATVLLCAHVLEHLDNPSQGLRWIWSRMCPGGQLFLAVSRPHWCTALLRWKWGHRAYSSAEVSALLEAAEFVEIRTVPFVSGPPSRTSMGYVAKRPH